MKTGACQRRVFRNLRAVIKDPTANMGFIRFIIKILLPAQPKWVQGVVLFYFYCPYSSLPRHVLQCRRR